MLLNQNDNVNPQEASDYDIYIIHITIICTLVT